MLRSGLLAVFVVVGGGCFRWQPLSTLGVHDGTTAHAARVLQPSGHVEIADATVTRDSVSGYDTRSGRWTRIDNTTDLRVRRVNPAGLTAIVAPAFVSTVVTTMFVVVLGVLSSRTFVHSSPTPLD